MTLHFQCFLIVSSVDKLPDGASNPMDGLDGLCSHAQLFSNVCIYEQEDVSQMYWLTWHAHSWMRRKRVFHYQIS